MAIESALTHPSGFAPPAPGGSAVLRTLAGEYFAGDRYTESKDSITIRLFGTQTPRTFQRAELHSLGTMPRHRQADARIIAERQRRGEPAHVGAITNRKRIALTRVQNGKTT